MPSRVCGALRQHHDGWTATIPLTRSCSSTATLFLLFNALLTSLAASDLSVRGAILQEIQTGASDHTLHELRHKRRGVRKVREAKRRQMQRLDALVTAECDAALQEVRTQDQKLQFFVAETYKKANTRLQTLFFECIVEIKKALVRMERVAADNTEESEIMVEDLMRRYDWQFFLACLQYDCDGDVGSSLLVPGLSRNTASYRLHRPRQANNSMSSVKAVLQKVLEEHGPALENGEALVVRSVSALWKTAPTRRASERNSKSTFASFWHLSS